jgi:thymidine phosphorylase
MLATETIRVKRDGGSLDVEQINNFVKGVVNNTWSDGQVAAMAMSIFQRGMTAQECATLTQAMMRSGDILQWKGVCQGPVLDKHSTGGVGDKVSLILAPLVAACGGYVPMISGRGLGHTGGTLDKLQSIPGYGITPDIADFQKIVARIGCAIAGQSASLAPADKRLYAIRDVTATVESTALITASILSKKLAAGVQGLVMDVKVGNGAFASHISQAQDIAQSIVSVAQAAGLHTEALITDMHQVLGRTCGNALEVREVIDFLTGVYREPRLLHLTRALSAELLLIGRLSDTQDAALLKIDQALTSGAAAERFAQMVTALGGPTDLMEQPGKYLASAPYQATVKTAQAGYLTSMQTRDIGLLLIDLGGGRKIATDTVNHSVGISDMLAVGTPVLPGQALCTVHATTREAAANAAERLCKLISIASDAPSEMPHLIYEKISVIPATR